MLAVGRQCSARSARTVGVPSVAGISIFESTVRFRASMTPTCAAVSLVRTPSRRLRERHDRGLGTVLIRATPSSFVSITATSFVASHVT